MATVLVAEPSAARAAMAAGLARAEVGRVLQAVSAAEVRRVIDDRTRGTWR